MRGATWHSPVVKLEQHVLSQPGKSGAQEYITNRFQTLLPKQQCFIKDQTKRPFTFCVAEALPTPLSGSLMTQGEGVHDVQERVLYYRAPGDFLSGVLLIVEIPREKGVSNRRSVASMGLKTQTSTCFNYSSLNQNLFVGSRGHWLAGR